MPLWMKVCSSFSSLTVMLNSSWLTHACSPPQTVFRPDGSAYYTKEQVNYYPTGITAMSIAGTVLATLCTSTS
jgi:hypothetical protein